MERRRKDRFCISSLATVSPKAAAMFIFRRILAGRNSRDIGVVDRTRCLPCHAGDRAGPCGRRLSGHRHLRATGWLLSPSDTAALSRQFFAPRRARALRRRPAANQFETVINGTERISGRCGVWCVMRPLYRRHHGVYDLGGGRSAACGSSWRCTPCGSGDRIVIRANLCPTCRCNSIRKFRDEARQDIP